MEFFNDYPFILAIAIFLARVLDVSIGTVRTILVIRSRRVWAAILGFFEVLVWLIAAGQVINNLDTWYFAIMYAGGDDDWQDQVAAAGAHYAQLLGGAHAARV